MRTIRKKVKRYGLTRKGEDMVIKGKIMNFLKLKWLSGPCRGNRSQT